MTREKDENINSCGTKNVGATCEGKDVDCGNLPLLNDGRSGRPARHSEQPDAAPKKDDVQEASEESFPASDPPSWTPTHS